LTSLTSLTLLTFHPSSFILHLFPMHGHLTHAFTIRLLTTGDATLEGTAYTLHAPSIEAAIQNVQLTLSTRLPEEVTAALIQCPTLTLSGHTSWNASLEGLRIPR
jgi:hypothetical protein